jgi:hypothetical protein
MRSYRTAMADNSMMFGAAHPVPRFLEQYRKELLLTAESVELTRTDSIAVD